MRVTHCGKKRQSTLYWMVSNKPVFEWEVIAQADCPKCKQLILEYYGFSCLEGAKFIERVRPKHYDKWHKRLKCDVIQTFTAEFLDAKNTRAKNYAGEYTHRIAQDPAVARHYVLKLNLQKAG